MEQAAGDTAGALDLNRELVEVAFDDDDVLPVLETIATTGDGARFDELRFGVIAMDRRGTVEHYNAHEAEHARLTPARVVGRNFFEQVGPCTDNALIAERFHQAAAGLDSLDETLPYVFTFVMRPTPVTLRMLAAARSPPPVPPGAATVTTQALPDTRDSDDLERVLSLVYQSPVGMLVMNDAGSVETINPAAARILAPALVGGEDLTSVKPVLRRLAPELVELIDADPHGWDGWTSAGGSSCPQTARARTGESC